MYPNLRVIQYKSMHLERIIFEEEEEEAMMEEELEVPAGSPLPGPKDIERECLTLSKKAQFFHGTSNGGCRYLEKTEQEVKSLTRLPAFLWIWSFLVKMIATFSKNKDWGWKTFDHPESTHIIPN
ncbi:hypothetical protein JRQ81_001887 [Phrynocephalus forsythii]|uniref:Uncharacterized protein n=1 Tax=Phrynocephalus forsythii TaxID=171643 RepID=A0A9Q0Y8S4_9SAUR|nr:hypothetical protein JRQ81_001887 [Phrynocephalus forsythii]